MVFIRKNFASGLLSSAMDEVANQLFVNAGHSLPTESGKFRLVIWDSVAYPNPADDSNTEIVTAEYSGTLNVYNIIRAQESTLAVSHNISSMVALHYTAGMSEEDLLQVGRAEVDETNFADSKMLVVDTSEGSDKLKYKDAPKYDVDFKALVVED